MSRLEELYKMRDFLDAEIVREQAILATPAGQGWIISAAADLYGVTVEEVLSPSRAPNATKARQAVCWLLRQRGLSLPQIGNVLDRDHTTVLYACRQIDGKPSTQAILRPLLTQTRAA